MPPLETPPTEKVTLLQRIEHHPYFAVTTGVLLMFTIGVAIVLERSAGPTGGGWEAWGGAGGISVFGDRARTAPQDPTRLGSPTDVELGFIPLPTVIGDEADEPAAELAELLALLSHPSAGVHATTSASASAFSFIPSGFVVSDPVRKRTPLEESLHMYGNKVGALVESFENIQRNSATTLKNHVEDRTNEEKIEEVRRLGYSFAQLGSELSKLDDIPASAKGMHAAYATQYRILGTNLIKVADTKDDEAFLSAINAYNESSDALTKRFLALVTLFGANNVTFSSFDAGRIFMFSPTLYSLGVPL
jgi:hypothetical protein